MAFGSNPTTTGQGSLATNQFPISSVAVPNAASGNLNALQGGPAAAADTNGNVLAPVSIYVYDGNDVTQGTSTDAANFNSVIGQLKQIKTNTGSVTIGTALPAGTNVIGHVIVDSAGSVSITSLPSLPSGTNVIGHVIVDSASSVSVTTLPGVGTDGSAIPSMSMLMGASDGTFLQQLLVESATNHNLRIGIYSGANEATVTGANALKVDNSAVTQPVSGVFWQSTQPVSAASLPLPTGASTSAKQPALGTAGTASTDVLTVQGIAAMTALKVDGSAVTQPVSGTVTETNSAAILAALDDGQETMANSISVAIASDQSAVPVSGTITANVGTTNGLALDATVAKLNIAQATALGSTTGPMMQGSVTAAAPTYTTGNINPISLTTAGAVRTDASATTQPVSGTITANAGTGTMTVGQTTGTNLHTVVDSGAITATTNADTTIGGTAAPAKELLIAGKTNDGTPQYQPLPEGTGGRSVIVEGVAGGTAVPVSGTFWQATQPVSGTVTSNVGTTNGLALDTSVNGVIVAQGSTTSGEKGPLIQGAVTSGAPSYTTAQTSPISLTTAGAIRTDASATTQPVSGTVSITANSSVNVAQVAGTTTDTNSGNKSAGTQRVVLATDQPQLTNALKVDGSAVTQPISAAALPLPSGASTSAKQPALGTAGSASSDVLSVQGIASMTALKVDGSGVTQPVSGTVTANAGTNLNTSTLALESGGNLATIATRTPALGQAVKASSSPVVIASDQGDLLVKGDFTEQASLSAAALNADLVASTDVSSYAWLSLHVTTIATGGTISFQASNDNFATQIESVNLARVSSTTTISSSTTTTGIYEGPVNFRYFRARQTAWTSGSSTGVLELYTVPRVLNIVPSASTQAGTWTVQPGNTANTTPWLATLNQGGNSATVTASSALKVDNSAVTQPVSGTVIANRQTSSMAALSVMGASTSSIAILVANTVRRGMTLYNDSSSAMYLAYAQNASTTVYTTKIPAASYYEMPTVPVYLGPLSAVWDTATGNARITELLA